MEPDSGTTNIRKVNSEHWARWLGPEHRCVVPFNSFSEFNRIIDAIGLYGEGAAGGEPLEPSPTRGATWGQFRLRQTT